MTKYAFKFVPISAFDIRQMFLTILFSLCLKIIIDGENYKSVYQKSFEMPVFFLIYSPHCPHCKSIHPAWEQLMEKYAKDENILIGDCNDISHRKECDFLYRTDSLPTFTTLIRGKAKRIHPTRNLESFINEAESLKQIDCSVNCSVYPTEFNGNYPAYLISGSENSSEKCEIVLRIQKVFPKALNHLYIYHNRTGQSRFSAILSHAETKYYDGPKELEPFIAFMKETMLVPFGDWSLPDAMNSHKKIGLYIHSTNQEFVRFGNIINNYFPNFTLNTYDLRDFKKVFPKLNYTELKPPIFAVSNTEKSKFYIIPSILKNPKAIQLINDALQDTFDELIGFDDLASLFSSQKVNPAQRPKIQEIQNNKRPTISTPTPSQGKEDQADRALNNELSIEMKERENRNANQRREINKRREEINKRREEINKRREEINKRKEEMIQRRYQKAERNQKNQEEIIRPKKASNRNQSKRTLQDKKQSKENHAKESKITMNNYSLSSLALIFGLFAVLLLIIAKFILKKYTGEDKVE